MRVNVTYAGLSAVTAALGALGRNAEMTVEEFAEELAFEGIEQAIEGIRSGPASGAIYRRYNPSRLHQASAPGEFPNEDLGALAGSIEISYPKRAVVSYGSSLAYAQYLEFGTSKMAARPWLAPSFQQAQDVMRGRLETMMDDAISLAVRGHHKRSHLRAARAGLGG
jgi:hypothetical protein